MRKWLLTAAFGLSLIAFTVAQDTTWVQTFTFDDLAEPWSTLRGQFTFPDEGKTYEKILMYYTLKCDQATKQDQFPCGEWDYLSYTYLFDSTGVLDSALLTHPRYLLGRQPIDSLSYRNSPGFDLQEYRWIERTIDMVLQEQQAISGNVNDPETYDGSCDATRIQCIWTPSELQGIGLTSGAIDRLGLFAEEATTIEQMQIRYQLVDEGIFDNAAFFTGTWQEVYTGDFSAEADTWTVLDLRVPLEWDGMQHLVLDISYPGQQGSALKWKAMPTAAPAAAQVSGTDRYAIFKGREHIEVPVEAINDLADGVTFSFWHYGDPANNPVNSSLLEARNANGHRVFNIHLSWGNGQVYWDAGNEGNSYDRINKPAQTQELEGRWNHWAFTKDVNSGEMRIFLNGELWHSGLDKNRGFEQATRFLIGANATGNYNPSYARVDEFQVWSKALDGQTIRQWMHRSPSASHPDYSHLKLYYSMDAHAGSVLPDEGPDAYDGSLHGNLALEARSPEDLGRDLNLANLRPIAAFHQGDYESHLDTFFREDTLWHAPLYVSEYEYARPPVLKDILIGWPDAPGFRYDWQGAVVETLDGMPDGQWIQETIDYYGDPFEIVDRWEIGRYITPYGIGLSLGPEGFTWIYDVTDYAHLLKGSKRLTSGNAQELHDLRFAFIEGTPPREVVQIRQVWPHRSYNYGQMAADEVLQKQSMELSDEAAQFMLKARITGHGHNTSNPGGAFPHCCEWWDNQHFMQVNNEQLSWSIWQGDLCGLNPVRGQGGNWAPPRAGWCPGDKVPDYTFDITDWVSPGGTVDLDYGISAVPANNPGMAGGNYIFHMELVEYGPPNFTLDAAVREIRKPNSWEYRRRYNPVCHQPEVVIQNTGATPLSSLTLTYGIEGGQTFTHEWTGSLDFMETETVVLPFNTLEYYEPVEQRFSVSISQPNGGQDEYDQNNSLTAAFEMVGNVIGEELRVQVKGNAIPGDVSAWLYNDAGDLIFQALGLNANEIVEASFPDLAPGCYSMTVETEEGLGLAYPLIPAVGSGYAGLTSVLPNGAIFTFASVPKDFGKRYTFDFTWNMDELVTVEEVLLPEGLEVFPNPTANDITVSWSGAESLERIEIWDMQGRRLLNREVNALSGQQWVFPMSDLPAGVYLLRGYTGKGIRQQKVIKQ